MHKDREERLAYARQYYRDNPKIYQNRARNRKASNRAWLVEYKASLKCMHCEEDDSCCLEFHHVDPEQKDRDVTAMVGGGWSIKKILEEIAKCLVLCANCHRKEHKRQGMV